MSTNRPRQYHIPPHHENGSDDEAEAALLRSDQHGPFNGPFDEARLGTHTPPHRPESHYSLTESYVGSGGAPPGYAKPYPDARSMQPGLIVQDPTEAFGAPPGRTPSPYDRASETSSTEGWRARQVPGGTTLKRFATRKVPLHHGSVGSVLSVDYPVPSPVQNSVLSKYRADLEGGSEEFTHMRCKSGTHGGGKGD